MILEIIKEFVLIFVDCPVVDGFAHVLSSLQDSLECGGWLVCEVVNESGVRCCRCGCGEHWVLESAGELAGGARECHFSIVWCSAVAVQRESSGVKSVEGRGRVAMGAGEQGHRRWVWAVCGRVPLSRYWEGEGEGSRV